MARGATFDIFAHKLCETGPPKFRGDELASFEITWVTSGLMVVAVGEDGTVEGVLRGDVDTTLIGQDAVIELPVGEARPEGGGDVLQRRL